MPGIEEERSRLFHRTREQLVRDRTRAANRIKMRLYQFGLDVPKLITQKSLEKILSSKDQGIEIEYSLKKHISIWKSLNKDIRELDLLQSERFKSNMIFKIYRSIPGYGLQTASMLLTGLGDMS